MASSLRQQPNHHFSRSSLAPLSLPHSFPPPATRRILLLPQSRLPRISASSTPSSTQQPRSSVSQQWRTSPSSRPCLTFPLQCGSRLAKGCATRSWTGTGGWRAWAGRWGRWLTWLLGLRGCWRRSRRREDWVGRRGRRGQRRHALHLLLKELISKSNSKASSTMLASSKGSLGKKAGRKLQTHASGHPATLLIPALPRPRSQFFPQHLTSLSSSLYVSSPSPICSLYFAPQLNAFIIVDLLAPNHVAWVERASETEGETRRSARSFLLLLHPLPSSVLCPLLLNDGRERQRKARIHQAHRHAR